MQSIDQQIQVLRRRCERIVPEEGLRAKLRHSADTGRPLRIKLGMDPTAPDVTLGHAVPLSVVRQFQEWGHKAVLIIGDYTARVGDPTGRNELRPKLDPAQIDANARTYVDQVGKIVLTDPQHLEVRFNGEWLAKMNMMEVIQLLSRKSVAQLLQREDFADRFTKGVEIRLHELMYPLLQGWDSVMIDADIEMGGSDQLFNNLVGREFQEELGGTGQVVIVTPLLVGTDGHIKMSKSKGNYIALTDPPSGHSGMFGKIMSLPDAVLESYYTLLTDLPPEQFMTLVREKPRDAKVALARHVISWMHSPQAAEQAEAEFRKVFSEGGVPDEMPEVWVGSGPHRLPPLIVKAGLASSNSEAVRKMKEGAVSLDGKKAIDPAQELTLASAVVLRLGRKFARLKP
jgi:tyrosyl-tRNA synthetase